MATGSLSGGNAPTYGGAQLVRTAEQGQTGLSIVTESVAITTTQTTSSIPSGALVLELVYVQLPGATTATGQAMYVTLNAASDSDAAAKLATAGARLVVVLGNPVRIIADPSNPITRVDYMTKAADATNGALWTIQAGVQL